MLSKTRYDDRPWVEVTPDGVAHAIWNDGSGVAYALSGDRGLTWTEQPRIHDQGGSSHLAVGPAGEIAVRITPVSASANVLHQGVDLVAVSDDGGKTWTKHAVPGAREWTFPYSDEDQMPRWVEPVAWDAAGRLYLLWTDPAGCASHARPIGARPGRLGRLPRVMISATSLTSWHAGKANSPRRGTRV